MLRYGDGKRWSVSPSRSTTSDMAATDTEVKAGAGTCPWYIAAYRGRDVINVQEFAKLRPGRRLTSRAWRGFQLCEEPADFMNFGYGYAHGSIPWEVWEVKPLRVIGRERRPRHEARRIRARRLEVVKCMAPGFEFGPNGHNVRALVEQLARIRPTQPGFGSARPDDYEIAMTFLEDQRSPGDWWHDARVSLAFTYLDSLASGSATGPIGRWKHHVGHVVPAATLIDAAVSGVPLPQVITRYWGLQGVGKNPCATR